MLQKDCLILHLSVDSIEELREKDSERYREYLSMVLSEIHQDTLRYRVNPNDKEESKADVLVTEEAFTFLEGGIYPKERGGIVFYTKHSEERSNQNLLVVYGTK